MNLFLARRYLRHFFTARHYKGHGIHSPFVFRLVNELFCQKHRYYRMDEIDKIRAAYLQSSESIVAKQSAIGQKHGELLFRLVRDFKPQKILELGTSLGISTLYLSLPDTRASVFTIDHNPGHLYIAEETFHKLKLSNVQTFVGDFDIRLPYLLQKMERIDFAFIDGNHQYESTLNYFNQCLALSHNDTVIAFHDIHWSEGMEAAWQQICAHPQVTVSIDLFHLGIVFFRKECKKEHFIVRF